MATGGYMLIFAVIIQIASSWLAPLLSPSLTAKPIAALLEVHLGSYALATTGLSSPLPAALTGALLGWSGLSAYLQARAALKPTGLSGVFSDQPNHSRHLCLCINPLALEADRCNDAAALPRQRQPERNRSMGTGGRPAADEMESLLKRRLLAAVHARTADHARFVCRFSMVKAFQDKTHFLTRP